MSLEALESPNDGSLEHLLGVTIEEIVSSPRGSPQRGRRDEMAPSIMPGALPEVTGDEPTCSQLVLTLCYGFTLGPSSADRLVAFSLPFPTTLGDVAEQCRSSVLGMDK